MMKKPLDIYSIRIRFRWAFIAAAVAASGSPVWAMAPQPGNQQQDATTTLFLMLGVFMAIIYFIVIRPQQKEQKRHQERINSLKKGDRVVTAGGLHGTVRSTKEKTLVLEIADGVKVTVNKSSISSVLDSVAAGGKKNGRRKEEDEDEAEE